MSEDDASTAVDDMTDFLNRRNAEKADSEKAPPSFQTETTPDGDLRLKANLSWKEAAELISAAKGYQQIMHGFAQKSFDRARAIQENPWANVATTIAGSLSQAPNMPGWVQGLGRANLQLNPSPERLIERGASYEDEGMRSVEGAMRAQDRALSIEGAIQNRQALNESRLEGIRVKALGTAGTHAEKGVESEGFYRGILKGKIDPEDLEATIQDFVGQGKAHNKLQTDLVQIKKEKEAFYEKNSAERTKILKEKNAIDGAYKRAIADVRTGKVMSETDRQRLIMRARELRQKTLETKNRAAREWEQSQANAYGKIAATGMTSKDRDAAAQEMQRIYGQGPPTAAYESDLQEYDAMIDTLNAMGGGPPAPTQPPQGVRPGNRPLAPSHGVVDFGTK